MKIKLYPMLKDGRNLKKQKTRKAWRNKIVKNRRGENQTTLKKQNTKKTTGENEIKSHS
jgi:hypothetical protein